jgi:hypothetical protein
VVPRTDEFDAQPLDAEPALAPQRQDDAFLEEFWPTVDLKDVALPDQLDEWQTFYLPKSPSEHWSDGPTRLRSPTAPP